MHPPAETNLLISFFCLSYYVKTKEDDDEDMAYYSYVVQHDADKNVERNTEEIHYGASCFFWDIL